MLIEKSFGRMRLRIIKKSSFGTVIMKWHLEKQCRLDIITAEPGKIVHKEAVWNRELDSAKAKADRNYALNFYIACSLTFPLSPLYFVDDANTWTLNLVNTVDLRPSNIIITWEI